MLKPGKIYMLAACAAILTLLSSCASVQEPALVEPEHTPPEITAGADPLPEILPGEEEISPEPPDEPDGELYPIPFYDPDVEPDDPEAVLTPPPVRIYVPMLHIEAENSSAVVSRKTSDPDKFEGNYPYFGRWIIQSRGIDVACYLSWFQDVVDAEDAAALFQLGDQFIIADHSNQDFIKLGQCQPGDLACLETEDGIAIYVCTAVVQGHNEGESISDDAGNSIEYGFNTGGITCYTCKNGWEIINIVRFSPVTPAES